MNTDTTDPWKKLDEFGKWLSRHPKHEPLPQAIGEVLGMGYGADDPGFQRFVEDYIARHEANCQCHV